MTPVAFVRECERRLREEGPQATVTLVFSGMQSDRQRRRHLWRRGPAGEVVGDACDGHGVLVRFLVAEILAALDGEAKRHPDWVRQSRQGAA